MGVRVGIYFDMRNPPRWRRPWVDHYRQALERTEEAERLGIDSVWLSEHHFFEDGYLPQPMTMAAALAARTSRVRIGTAILVAPLRPAVQIAEDAALVDILSGGRMELGLGAGYRVPEYAAFGADMARRYTDTLGRADEVAQLLADGGVTPGPVQSPLPVWVGFGGPRGARRAGRRGHRLLSIDPGLAVPYLEGLEEGGHGAAAGRMAGLMNVLVADDPGAARARLAPHLAYQMDTYGRYAVEDTGLDAPPPVDPAVLTGPAADVDAEAVFPHTAVLTAEETIALLRRRAGQLPLVEAFFWTSFAGLPDDLVDRHVGLLSSVVAPAAHQLPSPE